MFVEGLIKAFVKEVSLTLANSYPTLLEEYTSRGDRVLHLTAQCSGIFANPANLETRTTTDFLKVSSFGDYMCEVCADALTVARYEILWWSTDATTLSKPKALEGTYRILRRVDLEFFQKFSAKEQATFNYLLQEITQMLKAWARSKESELGSTFTKTSKALNALYFADFTKSLPPYAVLLFLESEPVYTQNSSGLFIVPLKAASFVWDEYAEMMQANTARLNTGRRGVLPQVLPKPYFQIDISTVDSSLWETVYTLHVKDGIDLEDAYKTAVALY